MKFLKEKLYDTVELNYDTLPIEYEHGFYTDWVSGPQYSTDDIEIEWAYEVPKDEVKDFLIDYVPGEIPDDKVNKYLEDNFDEMFEKYNKQILKYFEPYAIEDAEEKYEYEDPYINEGLNIPKERSMKFKLDNSLDLNEALDLKEEQNVHESLENDEISLFFKRAKEVGAKTLGDLKRLLQEPEFADKDEAQGMKDYRDSLGKDFKIEEALDLGKMQGIKLPDYYNTWSATDSLTVSIDGKEPVTYYLMENDEYGDETFYLVVTEDLKTIYETFDGIETCLRDELDTGDIKVVNNSSIKQEALHKDYSFEYQLLDRLRSDCDYYLGAGGRANKNLWAGNPEGPKASKVTMNYLANKANAHLGIDTSNPRGNYSYLTLNQQEYDTLSKAIEANGGKVSLIESAETRIKTPRGLIRVSDKSESELNKEGYGYWFSNEVDGVSYRVLNNGTYAVAVKKLSEGFENNYFIKESKSTIDENITLSDLDKQIADSDEEPVIDYANPNITSSPKQSKVVDINSIEGK